MAIVRLQTYVEGNIDKFEAYKALCEEVGLGMLTDGTANDYVVEDHTIYRLNDTDEKEVYSKEFKRAVLFETLLQVKCYL